MINDDLIIECIAKIKTCRENFFFSPWLQMATSQMNRTSPM